MPTLEERLSEAKRQWAEGRGEVALATLKSLEKEAPLYDRVTEEILTIYLKTGRRAQAIAHAEAKGKASDPKTRNHWAQVARNLARQFVSNPAFETYQTSLSHLISGQRAVARRGFLETLDREENHYLVLLRLGQLEALEGDWEKSMAYLDRAASVAPKEAETFLWKGYVSLSMKRAEEAVVALGRAGETLKSSEALPIWLAKSYLLKSDRRAALQVLERDLADHPLHVKSLIELSKLRSDPSASKQDFRIALSRLNEYTQQFEKGGFESEDGLPLFKPSALQQEIDQGLQTPDRAPEASFSEES